MTRAEIKTGPTGGLKADAVNQDQLQKAGAVEDNQAAKAAEQELKEGQSCYTKVGDPIFNTSPPVFPCIYFSGGRFFIHKDDKGHKEITAWLSQFVDAGILELKTG